MTINGISSVIPQDDLSISFVGARMVTVERKLQLIDFPLVRLVLCISVASKEYILILTYISKGSESLVNRKLVFWDLSSTTD